MQQPNFQQAQQRLEDVTTTVDNLSLTNNITITAVNAKHLINDNNNINNHNNNNNNSLRKVRSTGLIENNSGDIASPGSVPEARSPSGANVGYSSHCEMAPYKPFSLMKDDGDITYPAPSEIPETVRDAFFNNSIDDRKEDCSPSLERHELIPKSLYPLPMSNNLCHRGGDDLKKIHKTDKPNNLGKFGFQKYGSSCVKEDRKDRFSFNQDLVIKPVPSKVTAISKDVRDADMDMQTTNTFVLHSWHPHVYAKPPKTPTPHSILDILGTPQKKICFSPLIVRGASSKEHEEDRFPPSNGEPDDENFTCNEPLNLCLSKSRDVSPSSSISSRTVTPPMGTTHVLDHSRGLVNGRPDLIASSPGKLIHHIKGKNFKKIC
ncbi:hypothetical protein RUM43_007629 [Polyplax serrata]|uniref:Uncharacterized protein n=1 Tax=Polyplax serrata TaxID=468196 RepID=A0AAN8PD02_POLSC